ncbi:MAG: 16S rRNA (guanine(527)-N(7))-methyltransferase RsmG [Hyphomicrobiaceae bacterium]
MAGATATIASADDLRRVFSVSRETVDRLKIHESVLRKWQRAVNLVAPATLPDVWHRHFADSLQIAALVPENAKTLADLGSGGGFPGLVLAAHFADVGGPQVTLVESDQRKAAFLREAARAMEISVEILSTRIENDANLSALCGVDVVTARALARLPKLFALVTPFISAETVCLFMKGRDAAAEIAEARANWSFESSEHASMTDAEAKTLVIRCISAKAMKTEPTSTE